MIRQQLDRPRTLLHVLAGVLGFSKFFLIPTGTNRFRRKIWRNLKSSESFPEAYETPSQQAQTQGKLLCNTETRPEAF